MSAQLAGALLLRIRLAVRMLASAVLFAAAMATGWILWGSGRAPGAAALGTAGSREPEARERAVLNTAPCRGGEDLSGAQPALALNRKVLELKGRFFTESGRVDYRAMKGSPEWAAYEGLAGCLRSFDPAALGRREDRLAFWINLYNAMVVHGILAADIPESVTKVPEFFQRTAYEIGGLRFDLDAIEHGVLRGNRPRHAQPGPPFRQDDPRLRYSLPEIDPRVHFALVCGARSCPAVGVYAPESIDAQLELAARSFISQSVAASADGKELRLSSIFQWYEDDFGGRKGVLEFLRRRLSPGPALRVVQSQPEPGISYVDYDWSLNDAS